MSDRDAADGYRARDELFLWWVADPAQPTLIGQLNLVRSPRGVSLRYSGEWCRRGFPLSEDLPLLDGQEFMPRERDTAVGAVDDARPDRWGERVIRFLDKPRGCRCSSICTSPATIASGRWACPRPATRIAPAASVHPSPVRG